MSAALFTEAVESWRDWGRVCTIHPSFYAAGEGDFPPGRAALAASVPSDPGNQRGVPQRGFGGENFFPKESGLDPAVDFFTEAAASRQALAWGIPTPPLEARGKSRTSIYSTI